LQSKTTRPFLWKIDLLPMPDNAAELQCGMRKLRLSMGDEISDFFFLLKKAAQKRKENG